MSKKSLLSCTAAIAIMLFSTHFNTYAEDLNAGKGEVKKTEPGKTYNRIKAVDGGTINSEDLK
ncbi:hypothetical protein [Bartonella vinsonii]|uniref:hypothetical protein n=1 Tax=Bartonella vinsonii TaxID=33047 RepID=UPI0003A4A063|nr:hypothetical protein [Bartonella vinsonii]